MPLTVGSQAPDFTLKSKTPEGVVDITLSSNCGAQPTVLLFVPAAFTGVCTQEFCDISNGLVDLGEDVAVYGIAPDSPFALEAWAKQAGITIPLLSDYQRTVTTAYDVVFENFAGLGPGTARAAFIVDKNGKIAYAEQTATLRDLPDFAAIKATLASLS